MSESRRARELDFEQACRSAVEECRQLSYNPTAWVAMMDRHGAVKAASLLVTSGDTQSGFSRLVMEGRQDLTVEHAVLLPEWEGLFSPGVRESAVFRLNQARKGS